MTATQPYDAAAATAVVVASGAKPTHDLTRCGCCEKPNQPTAERAITGGRLGQLITYLCAECYADSF